MKNLIGKVVEIKIVKESIISWNLIYFFLIEREIHIPRARLKAPMKSPTTIVETPMEVAKIAKAPIPAVQRGQCASAAFGAKTKVTDKRNIEIFLMVSIDIRC